MDYQVLYRKYRPSNFDELVGQNHISTILKNSIINDRLAHTYIFTGPRGTGKTSTARIFAKSLNCLNPNNGNACDKCDNCINILSSPDVIELDAASNNGVDQIRELIDNVRISPTNSKYKVYIIDEVHMLSNQAWNAFLKTLEEPPSNVVFILATTEIQKVPITVLSRCQRLDFRRIDKDLIFNNLKEISKKEKIKIDDNVLEEIAYLADGCMRDAISILDQLSKASDKITIDVLKNNFGTVTNEEISVLYDLILINDIDKLTNVLNEIKKTGVDIKVLINRILEYFIDKAVDMKKKNVSTNAFKIIKKIIDNLNLLLSKINESSNGFLLLELELISFINEEDNQMSSNDVNKIISREIISEDKLNVNNLIEEDNNYYKICDKFIDIRVNNSFVDASKDEKITSQEMWNRFIEHIKNENIKDYLTLVNKTKVAVSSKDNMVVESAGSSVKIVGNSKLRDIENLFNNINKTDKKIIFISNDEWKNIIENFDKTKKYKIKDETKYINEDKSTASLAEDLFGDNIEIK